MLTKDVYSACPAGHAPYANRWRRIAPLIFSNVAGLSTIVAKQLIPTWAKFNGKTSVDSQATLGTMRKLRYLKYS